MSVKNYRFVSPGVFINEIDNSQLPASPAGQGPVIIGRAEKGPALRPVTVNSFSEFVQIFGSPSAGTNGDDVWRQGASIQAPTYGAYAAQAYLRNSSPLTFVRLLGAQTTDGTVTGEGYAGWKQTDAHGLIIFESDASPTAGSGSVTITGGAGAITPGKIITISDGVTSIAYTSATTQDVTANEFANITSNAAIATSLAACIEDTTDGHGTTITVVDDEAGELSLTQKVAGFDGNVTITTDAGDVTVTGFAGGTSITQLTGALAGIFYAQSGVDFLMSGAVAVVNTSSAAITSGDGMTGSNLLVGNLQSNQYQFKVVVDGASDSAPLNFTSSFNFDVNSSKYIRKVFNTNPQLLNSDITDAANRVNYFLGETFDRHLKANISTSNTSWGTIVKLYNASDSLSGSNFRSGLVAAQTPWIIGSNLGDNVMPNLIRFTALGNPGDWTNRSIKISIEDVKVSTNESTDYGTFSVVVRSLSDSDNVVRIIEQFNDCDLNPNSLNFVSRKIGDKYRTWVEAERRYKWSGDYANNSDFIRVEVSSDIRGGSLNANYLPFGNKGIVKYKDDSAIKGGLLADLDKSGSWVTGSSLTPLTRVRAVVGGQYLTASLFVVSGNANDGSQYTASVIYPDPELRVSASDGSLATLGDAYFGFQTSRTAGSSVFDHSNIDLLRPRGGIVGSDMFTVSSVRQERSPTFTLDDVSGTLGVWVSGSWDDSSLTYVNGYVTGVLDAGFDRFTVPMCAGFDGLNIDEMAPFRDGILDAISPVSDQNSYQFNSIRRSIDAISDPEVVEMNLASIPGTAHEGLTSNLINVCEDRGDALAVVDLGGNFVPRSESSSGPTRNNTASVLKTVINNLRARGLNSSYGCCFYPWVRARDTINGSLLWLPPSIAAIGTFSSSQRKTQVWFAPAGFNRGGLTEGSAGIPVIDVAHQLRRKDRDDLYAANINPIAKFPSEGIVIFGQKTLQVTPSALDRINVRRLMIFIKKRISQMASRILFDQNVKTTWSRFTSVVDPFLADVKTNFGLTDYKVVLDDTTTTPDMIDRNILYAKIFLKPARAIEYIAIDFNITRTGASFTD